MAEKKIAPKAPEKANAKSVLKPSKTAAARVSKKQVHAKKVHG